MKKIIIQQKRKGWKIISKLIHANEHRSEVYRRCYNKTTSTDLKIAFNKYYSSCITNITALSAEVSKLGFRFTEEESATDMIFNVLLDLRSSFSGTGRNALLTACQYAEEKALAGYRMAMNSKALLNHPSLLEVLSTQLEVIMEANLAIRSLKNESHSNENAICH